MESLQPAVPPRRGLVLVADGFDEHVAVYCLRLLRDAGIAAALVGLPAGLVTGNRGIAVSPDLSLDEVPPGSMANFVVIPGRRRSAGALLTDPRVHHLVEEAVAAGGAVAVLGTAVEEAERLLRVPCVCQGNLTVHDFVSRLLHDVN
jgi:putative intracellular protease/amidase